MQLFHTDQQTSDDLNIFETSVNARSIFSYYDFTTTIGGKNMLRQIFKNPITDGEEINYRSDIIKHFLDNNIDFVFNRETIDFIEFYLKQSDFPKSFSTFNALRNSWKYLFSPAQEYYLKRRGVEEVLDLIMFLDNHLSHLSVANVTGVLEDARLLIDEMISNKTIQRCVNLRPNRLSMFDIERCDFALRSLHTEKIKALIDIVYKIDVFNSVARATKLHNLNFPVFELSGDSCIKLEGVFHLFLSDPVPNDFYLDSKKNVCVITGVNMSGKSTIIKSIALALYLAHLGFPVPAAKMTTSIFNGLLTTINLSDDLSNGTSHYYNEVKRVKYVSEIICQTSNVFVVFDELFRGTNVKDAFDSSLSIIDKFSQIEDTFFIISTHIVETANKLKDDNEKVAFYKLQTLMENGAPVYNYTLQQGITGDRMGFWILKNAGVFELLQQKIDYINK